MKKWQPWLIWVGSSIVGGYSSRILLRDRILFLHRLPGADRTGGSILRGLHPAGRLGRHGRPRHFLKHAIHLGGVLSKSGLLQKVRDW